MTPAQKGWAGLGAALAVGGTAHGPAGMGAAFIDRLEAEAQAVVAAQQVAGVTVQMQRDPLARTAVMSGPANRFQREGMGSLPGFDRLVLAVPGIARVRWTNPPPS